MARTTESDGDRNDDSGSGDDDGDDGSASSERLLEAAFGHIRKGNEASDRSDFWDASIKFIDAHSNLDRLLSLRQWQRQQDQETTDASANAEGEDDGGGGDIDEAAKITSLYESQSKEYFDRARKNLLKAMLAEHDEDLKVSNSTSCSRQQEEEAGHQQQHQQGENVAATGAKYPSEYRFRSLPDEQHEKRLELFCRLYADEKLLLVRKTQGQADQQQRQQSSSISTRSLEERLMQLNENLPQGFKTSEHRMREINRGLNRLGFSSIPTGNNSKIDALQPPKSESEQVADIIAQAKDEVALGIGPGSGGGKGPNISSSPVTGSGGGQALDDIDDMLLDDDSDLLLHDDSSSNGLDDSETAEDNSDEVDLTPEQIGRIRDSVVDAQAQLAQLLALVSVDDGGDAEIEFEPGVGKLALTRARKFLARANREWTNSNGNKPPTTTKAK